VSHLFLFGGRPGQRFNLDRRSDLETSPWKVGVELEFFEGSGTLFYFETVPLEKAPEEEFFQATLYPD
jgi:hypothetical protein